tara:strand:- start:120 stop:674 length:555 start_codon:yes stop_codon:yes gene_type:complete
MRPLARNVDFYGFLPSHSKDKALESSLHFANAVFLLQGEQKSYGRPTVFATAKDDAGSQRLDRGTVVWGKDDDKVAELLGSAVGYVVVFTKQKLGSKAQAQVDKLKKAGRVVYELSAIKEPHRLYASGSGHVLQSWGVVDGKKAFVEVVVKPSEKPKKKTKKSQPKPVEQAPESVVSNAAEGQE